MAKKEMPEGKRKVLEAAFELFSEKGFAGASTGEIAKRAGVAEGTIFKHYSSKKELFLRIGFYLLEKLPIALAVNEIKDIIDHPHPSFEALATAIAKNRIAFVRKNPRMIKLLIQELPLQPELMAKLRDGIGKTVFPTVFAQIRTFQEKGEIAAIAPERIIRMLMSLLIGYVITSTVLLPDRAWNDDEEVSIMIRTLLGGLTSAGAD